MYLIKENKSIIIEYNVYYFEFKYNKILINK